MDLKDPTFWETQYACELNLFNDTKDPGEVWFGKRLNNKIGEYIVENICSLLDQKEDQDLSIVDIGCGNSYLLVTLSKLLKEPAALHGIDFSPSAIKLSRGIIDHFADQRLNTKTTIDVKECDFLDIENVKSSLPHPPYDILVDKGTLDAILLIAEADGKSPNASDRIQSYKDSIIHLVRHGTIFILASCNQTYEELRELFAPRHRGFNFKIEGTIATPSMSFGGATGSQVACVIFKMTKVDT